LHSNGSYDFKSFTGEYPSSRVVFENMTDDDVTDTIRQTIESERKAFTKHFHKPYYAAIKPFEKVPQEGVNYTFGAFAG
jgi:hypothetical protein